MGQFIDHIRFLKALGDIQEKIIRHSIFTIRFEMLIVALYVKCRDKIYRDLDFRAVPERRMERKLVLNRFYRNVCNQNDINLCTSTYFT